MVEPDGFLFLVGAIFIVPSAIVIVLARLWIERRRARRAALRDLAEETAQAIHFADVNPNDWSELDGAQKDYYRDLAWAAIGIYERYKL